MSDELSDLARAALAFAEAILAAREPAPRNLSIAEAASLLGVSRSTVYNRLRTGELRSVRIGRRRLIPSSELERLRQ